MRLLLALVLAAGCANPASPDAPSPAAPSPAAEVEVAVEEATSDPVTDPVPDPASALDASATPDNLAPLDTAAVRSTLRDLYGADAALTFGAAKVDLDGDGQDEVVVHVVGADVCGSGGCDTVVLVSKADGYVVVSAMGVSRTPIGVDEARTNGWRDLLVTIGGGGGRSGIARLQFDGAAYPSNPTTAPEAELDGAPLLTDDDVRSPLNE